ncbi:BTB domain-containing protein [Mycena venus]|uniref:BTB domain-containing protein n=1 Tax=Mycena venus TaxID=2733690 RepID=A0A8H6XB98_9AGAR|nr:BTB domain-containing protein [Mycena venus]
MSQPESFDEAPPAKRRRMDMESTITRSDIWHNDGSVVLQAERKQFRVHWGVLCLHSAFFRDLQGLPQPPTDQSSVEGCPVVELHDSSTDVKYLLKALYDPLLFSKESLHFALIAAIVRPGRKYDFKNLLAAAVQRLTHENPTSLEKYESSYHIANNQIIYSPKQIHDGGCLTFDTITLAWENNLFAILPCAYFRAVFFYDQETILDGIPRDNGLPATLSAQDQRLCILGSKRIVQAQWELERLWNWLSSDDGCTGNEGCTVWKSTVFRRLVKTQAPLAPFSLPRNLKMCIACATKHAEIVLEARKKLWDQLPVFFDLPPWAELKNDS